PGPLQSIWRTPIRASPSLSWTDGALPRRARVDPRGAARPGARPESGLGEGGVQLAVAPALDRPGYAERSEVGDGSAEPGDRRETSQADRQQGDAGHKKRHNGDGVPDVGSAQVPEVSLEVGDRTGRHVDLDRATFLTWLDVDGHLCSLP